MTYAPGRDAATTSAPAADLVDETEIVSLASALIEAGGENPGDTEQRTADVLEAWCTDLGFDVTVDEVAPGRPNVDVSFGRAEVPGLLFVGHSDVVPVGLGWTRDPFTPNVDGRRLYGRGSADMKGGLAAVVGAMSAVRRSGAEPLGPIWLTCLIDEEDTGLGVRSWVSQPPRSEFAYCVVAEPTSLVPIVGCRGASNLRITVTGKSAHAGRPEDGRSAITAAARIVAEIEVLHDESARTPHPLLGPATWNVGRIDGGTGPSIVAGRCVLEVDRRLLPDETAADVVASLRDRLRAVVGPDIGVDVEIEMEMPGFETDPRGTLAMAAMSALASAGVPATGPDVWTASCDGGFVARDLGTETLVLGPGDVQGQAHQPDESVPVDELVAAARAYVALIVGTVGLAQ